MDKAKQRLVERKSRAARVRKKISGSTERPRLCIRRSLQHIYAQIIDDTTGVSLVQAGSTSKEFAAALSGSEAQNKTAVSGKVGELLAQKAKEKGISSVVFDRKGYLFAGRVKALAEAARKAGLVF
jgi:large subunit ribosomal protein L18